MPDPVGTTARRVTPGRIGLGVLVVGMLTFWVWIFLFAPRDNPDRLEETTFTEQAEGVCVVTRVAIDDLPSPRETPLPADRAVPVATATDLVEEMVGDLRELTGLLTVAEEIDLVDAWLADWDVYIIDRRNHVVKLETAEPDTDGRDLAFTLTERAAGGIYTRRIDGFANVNNMESCAIPGDI